VQLSELTRVLKYPKLKPYISQTDARELLRGLRMNADIVRTSLPTVHHSPDPDDNKIIATAIAGEAHYLVTGDKNDLLHLECIGKLQIISASHAVKILAVADNRKH
jgi:putative PIN family toxin of toxin-antitoxin system